MRKIEFFRVGFYNVIYLYLILSDLDGKLSFYVENLIGL